MYPPRCADSNWVAGTQRCFGLSGLWIPNVARLFGLWIPNVASAYLGCGYPTLLRLYWVVDTQRCSGLFGLWIPNVDSAYLGCGYPMLLGYLGCGYPTLFRLIWVVDTQRCFGLSGLWIPNVTPALDMCSLRHVKKLTTHHPTLSSSYKFSPPILIGVIGASHLGRGSQFKHRP